MIFLKSRERENMNIPIISELREARVDRDGCLVEGIILTSGVSENGAFYPPEVVEKAAEIFNGVQCYTDHPRESEGERSVRDLVGQIEHAWAQDGNLRATIRLSRAHDWLLTMIGEGLVGDLSINALGRTKVARRDGRVVREVVEISKAHSVDFVARAAAGGRVEKILRESAGYAESLRLLERISLEELEEARPDLLEKLREQIRNEFLEENSETRKEIREIEEELERQRIALEREKVATRLISSSGLPEDAKKFVLTEALSLEISGEQGDDGKGSEEALYEKAVQGLIERHRTYLAGLSSKGLIRGMGSEKGDGAVEDEKRRTLRLMGIV
jgi:hypothetical protein